jgi:hypothetical protein
MVVLELRGDGRTLLMLTIGKKKELIEKWQLGPSMHPLLSPNRTLIAHGSSQHFILALLRTRSGSNSRSLHSYYQWLVGVTGLSKPSRMFKKRYTPTPQHANTSPWFHSRNPSYVIFAKRTSKYGQGIARSTVPSLTEQSSGLMMKLRPLIPKRPSAPHELARRLFTRRIESTTASMG